MMSDFINDKKKAYEEHRDKFSCTHESQELRKRTLKNGSCQYVYQCLKCGKSQGQALKRERALEINPSVDKYFFDQRLKEKWTSNKKTDFDRIGEEFENKREQYDNEFWDSYDEYLKTIKWKKTREKVLLRAKGICEGCRENKAVSAHHLSYDHVGNEFLFELVAVCQDCHDRLHEEDSESE